MTPTRPRARRTSRIAARSPRALTVRTHRPLTSIRALRIDHAVAAAAGLRRGPGKRPERTERAAWNSTTPTRAIASRLAVWIWGVGDVRRRGDGSERAAS